MRSFKRAGGGEQLGKLIWGQSGQEEGDTLHLWPSPSPGHLTLVNLQRLETWGGNTLIWNLSRRGTAGHGFREGVTSQTVPKTSQKRGSHS